MFDNVTFYNNGILIFTGISVTLRTSTLMYPVARSKNHTTAFSTDYNNKSRSIGVYHAMGAARAWHSHGTREGARLRPGKTLQQSHLKPFIHY